jgi:hypothetical protein
MRDYQPAKGLTGAIDKYLDNHNIPLQPDTLTLQPKDSVQSSFIPP